MHILVFFPTDIGVFHKASRDFTKVLNTGGFAMGVYEAIVEDCTSLITCRKDFLQRWLCKASCIEVALV